MPRSKNKEHYKNLIKASENKKKLVSSVVIDDELLKDFARCCKQNHISLQAGFEAALQAFMDDLGFPD